MADADRDACGDAGGAGALSPDQLKLVLDVARTLTLTTDLDVLLHRIAESTTQLLRCERASIFLHDPQTNQLWTKVALQSNEIRVPSTAGIVGACFMSNEVLLIPDAYADPRFNPAPDRASGFRTRNILSAPMLNSDRTPIGVVEAINKITGAFSPSDVALIQLLSDQAGVAIQRYRLQVAAMQAAELRREAQLARRVQQAMLPKSTPQLPNIDVMGWTRPASVTGGDCYDFWKTRDGRLAIFLADASGHGLGPTIIVSQVRTLIRAMCDIEPDPSRLLALANARVADDLEGDRFVTAFIGYLSPDGAFTYASAGHGPLLCRGTRDDSIRQLSATHTPLGITSDLVGDPAPTLTLAPGGWFIVVSDGIFEAPSPTGETFGMVRVLALLNDACNATAEEVIARLRDNVTRWQAAQDPVDDQTVVVCRRIG
jgi:sigma-B regulation protein RsbU (phosphoserine phosphatase)